MMQHSIGAWGDVLASAVVLAALMALAGAIVRIDRRLRAARPANDAPKVAVVAEVPEATEAAEAIGRLAPKQEWELVIRRGTQGLEREATLATLQASTALKIAAAEHAYNRLVLDCAKVCSVPAAPTVVPARRPAHPPVRSPRTLERPDRHRDLAA